MKFANLVRPNNKKKVVLFAAAQDDLFPHTRPHNECVSEYIFLISKSKQTGK